MHLRTLITCNSRHQETEWVTEMCRHNTHMMHPCKKKRNTHTFSSLIVNLSNIVDWVHEEEQGSLSLNALTLHFISPYTILFAMFPPTCVLIIISVVLYVQSAYIYIFNIYTPFFHVGPLKLYTVYTEQPKAQYFFPTYLILFFCLFFYCICVQFPSLAFIQQSWTWIA